MTAVVADAGDGVGWLQKEPISSRLPVRCSAGALALVHHATHGVLLTHICKGARQSCAQALISTLQDICRTPRSVTAWVARLEFASSMLAQPARADRRRNMTKIIKDRTTIWLEGASPSGVEGSSQSEAEVGDAGPAGRQRALGGEGALLAAVNAKLEDGNIRAAVRILCDGAPPAIPNEQNLKLLMEKHPLDPNPEALGRLPTPDASGSWQVTPAEVLRAVRTFPAGSAAGPDGFRPGHLGDLVGFGGNRSSWSVPSPISSTCCSVAIVPRKLDPFCSEAT